MFTNDTKFFQKAVITHPENGTILALKRSERDTRRPGDWDLPGGNVEYGEDAIAAIIREIDEETKIAIMPESLHPIHVITWYDETHCTIIIGYKAKASDTVISLSHEHTEYVWMEPQEFIQKTEGDYLKEIVEKSL